MMTENDMAIAHLALRRVAERRRQAMSSQLLEIGNLLRDMELTRPQTRLLLILVEKLVSMPKKDLQLLKQDADAALRLRGVDA